MTEDEAIEVARQVATDEIGVAVSQMNAACSGMGREEYRHRIIRAGMLLAALVSLD